MGTFDKVKRFVSDHEYEIVSGIFYGVMVGSAAYVVYQTGKLVGFSKGFNAGGLATEHFVKAYEPEAYERLRTLAEGINKAAKAI